MGCTPPNIRRSHAGLSRLAGLCVLLPLILAGAAGAFQVEQTQQANNNDLPPEIRALPFEIRDGYRRFVKNCTRCHDAGRVTKAKKTLFEWQGVIGAMALKPKANIPLEDRQHIFHYLSYLHGQNGTPQEKDDHMTFLKGCENCHGIGIMYRNRYPMKDWPNIVHRMAGKNQARISPEDEAKVMRYIQRMSPDLFGIE